MQDIKFSKENSIKFTQHNYYYIGISNYVDFRQASQSYRVEYTETKTFMGQIFLLSTVKNMKNAKITTEEI